MSSLVHLCYLDQSLLVDVLQEIKKIAIKAGAEVPFLRPKILEVASEWSLPVALFVSWFLSQIFD